MLLHLLFPISSIVMLLVFLVMFIPTQGMFSCEWGSEERLLRLILHQQECGFINLTFNAYTILYNENVPS